MPQVIVTTNAGAESARDVFLRERVSMSDFESDHFCGQLVERIGWAVLDAYERELGTSTRIAERRAAERHEVEAVRDAARNLPVAA